jgi:multidrug efflux pump subunit AcrB
LTRKYSGKLVESKSLNVPPLTHVAFVPGLHAKSV